MESVHIYSATLKALPDIPQLVDGQSSAVRLFHHSEELLPQASKGRTWGKVSIELRSPLYVSCKPDAAVEGWTLGFASMVHQSFPWFVNKAAIITAVILWDCRAYGAPSSYRRPSTYPGCVQRWCTIVLLASANFSFLAPFFP